MLRLGSRGRIGQPQHSLGFCLVLPADTPRASTVYCGPDDRPVELRARQREIFLLPDGRPILFVMETPLLTETTVADPTCWVKSAVARRRGLAMETSSGRIALWCA